MLWRTQTTLIPDLQFSFEASDTSRFRDSAESSPVKATGAQSGSSELEEDLSCKSSYSKILNGMMTDGMVFISHQKNVLPPHTFVAADAVNWLLTNIPDIENDLNHAISLMKDMLTQRYIIHASGNPNHPFIYGFYFYSILPNSTGDANRRDSDSTIKGVTFNFDSEFGHCFQLEWTEVAFPIRPLSSICNSEVPFLAAELPTEHFHNFVDFNALNSWCENQVYSFFSESSDKKILSLDVENTNREKSTRPEWVMWQYASNFDPACAFDLELRWLVATGGRLNDVISIWRKKASQLCGLHLLPVPCHQFAFPNTPDCDPLRGPIFIHLELDDIRRIQGNNASPFSEFPAKTRRKRLALFQESILSRFGFLSDGVYNRDENFYKRFNEARTYVHCSGGMFVMIPDYSTIESRAMFGPKDPNRRTSLRLNSFQDYSSSSLNQCRTNVDKRSDSSLEHYYVKREPRQTEFQTTKATVPVFKVPETVATDVDADKVENKDESEEDASDGEIGDAGFIWAWNYMLTKRWRSTSTGDELFQDRMLADFRAFCSNKDGRLVEYWLQCQEKCCEQDLSPTTDTQETVM